MDLNGQEPGNKKVSDENSESFIVHKVRVGETMYSIGKKYHVSVQEINAWNPQLVAGLKSGTLLKIPRKEETPGLVKDTLKQAPTHYIIHKVRKKETFYFISKKYGVTIGDIMESNPGLTELKRGDILQIPQWDGTTPSGKEEDTETSLQEKQTVTHWVQKGETWYSISRKYGRSITVLQEANPEVKEIKTGQRLMIPPAENYAEAPSEPVVGYFEHTISKGETLYSLSKRYQVSPEEISAMNPGLEKSFRKGSRIRIPVKKEASEQKTDTLKSDMIRHVVVQGETIFGLSKTYEVSIDELVEHNPFLRSRVPRAGDTLLIVNAVKDIVQNNEITEEETGDPSVYTEKGLSECMTGDALLKFRNQKMKIVLLVPVMLNLNRSLNKDMLGHHDSEDSDDEDNVQRSGSRNKGIQFHGTSENFLHFYEGALIAVDSLEQMGVKIDLIVHDTEQNSSRVNKLVSSGALDDADLIIGPVYPEEQKELAGFVRKKCIPVVSPLSATDDFTKNNPFFFQINPPRELIMDKTNDYLINQCKNCNIVVVQTASTGSLSAKIKANLDQLMQSRGKEEDSSEIKLCDFGGSGYSALRALLRKDRKNLILIPSNSEVEVSVIMSNIQNIASEFDVSLVGSNRFLQFESINPDLFYKGKLEFLSPYWPDENQPVTRSFEHKFRRYFKADPNQFSMQGYDVTFFFGKALFEYGADFRNCISHATARLVQGNYHFSKLPSGGFINDGLSVIKYTPDYQINKTNPNGSPFQ